MGGLFLGEGSFGVGHRTCIVPYVVDGGASVSEILEFWLRGYDQDFGQVLYSVDLFWGSA